MEIGIVFTNDWELFGDGSGNYFDIQEKPLRDILEMNQKYGSKITIMAETMQNVFFKMHSENKHLQDVSAAWDKVLEDTLKSGSDVQLHLHPQWLGAGIEKGEINLNMDKWAIGKLDKNISFELLKSGKMYLENLLQPINPDYKCIGFRAGAYGIEPSENIITALNELNFQVDSSVTKGFVNPGFFDFSNAHSNFKPWNVSTEDIKKSGSSDLLEFPIYAVTGIESQVLKKFVPSLYYKLKFGTSPTSEESEWAKERDRIKEERYPRNRRFYKKGKKNLKWFANALLSKTSMQLDYDYLPASAFMKVIEDLLRQIEKEKLSEKYNFLPIIASGHTKDMHSIENLESIVKSISDKYSGTIKFMTLTEAVKKWKNK